MKHLKMLGLAAMAVVALMAVIGAGSASATTLCSENGTPCPEAKRYKKETAYKSVLEGGTKVVFDAGFYKVECTASSISGKISNEGGAGAVIIGLETVSFEGCGCEVKTLKAGSMSVEHTTGTMNGKLTTANIEVSIPCMGKCVYGEGPLGTLTGGGMGTMDISGLMNRVMGNEPGCPKTITWEASYTVTAPEPIYVAEA